MSAEALPSSIIFTDPSQLNRRYDRGAIRAHIRQIDIDDPANHS